MKLRSYAQAYRQNSVNTASPARLILMLFDGALRFMNTAVAGFQEADFIARQEMVHNHLIKTQAIIDELQSSLDFTHGEFPRRMSSLYDFMRIQLVQANNRKDPAPIVVVIGLISEIREAWSAMTEQMENPAASGTEAGLEFAATAA